MTGEAAPAQWLEGAFDLHVHAGPSFFPRWGSAGDVVRGACAAGMRGVTLKAHEGSTVAVAAALDDERGTRVRGGVVLNRYVGGINPDAAEAALRLGARCIWFPTIDAADHVRAYGGTGAYDRQAGGRTDGDGFRVLDAEGALTDAAAAVLDLVHEHDCCVATGHLGGDEIDAVVRRCADLGHQRVLVQHACARTPGLDADAIARHAAAGAHIELTWLAIAWDETTVSRAREALERAGGRAVIASDAGQAESPPPPAALASFADALHRAGVDERAIRRALTTTPRALIEP